MKAKDIINQLLESKNIKAGPFAKEIGVHPTQIYDLQSEKIKKISASIASKIVNRYPEYDPIWLLTGEGEMLKSEPASLDLESKTNKTSAPHQIETKNINNRFTWRTNRQQKDYRSPYKSNRNIPNTYG